jgi:hypothetical protein
MGGIFPEILQEDVVARTLTQTLHESVNILAVPDHLAEIEATIPLRIYLRVVAVLLQKAQNLRDRLVVDGIKGQVAMEIGLDREENTAGGAHVGCTPCSLYVAW